MAVSATSASDTWAVGSELHAGKNQTLVLHWNGTSWQQMTVPQPAGNNGDTFNAVAATSASNAWAAGFYFNSKVEQRTFLAQWDGSAWRQVPSPTPGTAGATLNAVTASSANQAWSVGTYQPDVTTSRSLVLRCQ
jgi:hypothetical protein